MIWNYQNVLYLFLFFNILPIISWGVYVIWSNNASLAIAMFGTVTINGMIIYKIFEAKRSNKKASRNLSNVSKN